MRIRLGGWSPRIGWARAQRAWPTILTVWVGLFWLSSPNAWAIPVPPSELTREPLDLAVGVVALHSSNRVQADALAELLEYANGLVGVCGVRFRLESFERIEASQARLLALSPEPAEPRELERLRQTLALPDRLLVVITAGFRAGSSLARLGANAWTMVRTDRPEGAVIEARGMSDPRLLAHELGHYLGLSHDLDPTNLMSATLHNHSTHLNPAQCEQMRGHALVYRGRALRGPVRLKPELAEGMLAERNRFTSLVTDRGERGVAGQLARRLSESTSSKRATTAASERPGSRDVAPGSAP